MSRIKWLVVLLAIFLAACQPAGLNPGGPIDVSPTSALHSTIPYAPPAAGGYPPAQATQGGSANLDVLGDKGYPAPGGDIKAVPWQEAKALILGGRVTEVFQLHNLTVTMKLDDGTVLQSIEPAIDEVFKIIEQCGEKCSNIMKATE